MSNVLLRLSASAVVEAFIKVPKVAISVGISVVDGTSVEVIMEINVGTKCVIVVVVVVVVDEIIAVVVSISSSFLGTKGYWRQGKAIGGPSMFSKT